MIRQIEDGGLAGRSAVLDRQLVLLRERVDDLYVELTGVALLTVGSDVAESDPIRRSLLGVPDDGVEALEAAVQCVRAVIDRELIALPVEAEAALGYAIGIAATDGTEVGFFAIEILLEAVVSDDDIRPARAARNDEGDELGALVDEVCFGALLIGEAVEAYLLAVDDPLEGLRVELCFVAHSKCSLLLVY